MTRSPRRHLFIYSELVLEALDADALLPEEVLLLQADRHPDALPHVDGVRRAHVRGVVRDVLPEVLVVSFPAAAE